MAKIAIRVYRVLEPSLAKIRFVLDHEPVSIFGKVGEERVVLRINEHTAEFHEHLFVKIIRYV